MLLIDHNSSRVRHSREPPVVNLSHVWTLEMFTLLLWRIGDPKRQRQMKGPLFLHAWQLIKPMTLSVQNRGVQIATKMVGVYCLAPRPTSNKSEKWALYSAVILQQNSGNSVNYELLHIHGQLYLVLIFKLKNALVLSLKPNTQHMNVGDRLLFYIYSLLISVKHKRHYLFFSSSKNMSLLVQENIM